MASVIRLLSTIVTGPCQMSISFTLDVFPIPPLKVWPLSLKNFTQAPEPLPYVKRPSMLRCRDIKVFMDRSDLLLNEAQVCKILKKSSGPNIAQYFGCIVNDGQIRGLDFHINGMTSSERVTGDSRPSNGGLCLRRIQEDKSRLHCLGLVRCNIDTADRFMNGDSLFIVDNC